MRFGSSPSRARRVIREGDTIVSTVRTYLKAALSPRTLSRRTICSTGFSVLTPRPEDIARFWGYVAQSEPFTALELLSITTATITSWPTIVAAVEITGTFGWASVPGVIKELAIYLTRDKRDMHKGGATMTIDTLDGPVVMSNDTFGRWMGVVRDYSRRLPAFA